ncbi:unnamed protein product, partial [Pleuronectes platessa]
AGCIYRKRALLWAGRSYHENREAGPAAGLYKGKRELYCISYHNAASLLNVIAKKEGAEEEEGGRREEEEEKEYVFLAVLRCHVSIVDVECCNESRLGDSSIYPVGVSGGLNTDWEPVQRR